MASVPNYPDLNDKEKDLIKEVRKHPALGISPAFEVAWVLRKIVRGFSSHISPKQENLIRTMAKVRGVELFKR